MNEKLQGFHVSRLARDHYQIDPTLTNYLGKASIANTQVARRFANRINQRRENSADSLVQPSQIYAMALIQAITQHLFQLYCEQHPGVLQDALNTLQAQLGPDVDQTFRGFLDEFPPTPVYEGASDINTFLTDEYEARPNRETTLEELLLLWLENANPAQAPFREFFGDVALGQRTAYPRLTAELQRYFNQVAQNEPGGTQFPAGMSIIDLLLEPVRAAPNSLEGQLRFLIERWGAVVEDYIFRLMMAIDILIEDIPHPSGPPGPPGKGESAVPSYDQPHDLEYEAFTRDRDWMPNLIMIAKNAYVWLDQLSKQYRRPITTLDQVPDEELDRLARYGITGLWLIGLWERSRASQRIKQIMGNPDAVASAYSLYDYQIAERLGGDAACSNLRERAWQRGIRLASDMVPNHVGIDGKWVVEHPDWFISLDYAPYPNYSFNGVDLSSDERVGIFIEDHYYDRTDAAVVFKRLDRYTGDVRYLYHGNDGTSIPWNDTAQLDYLNPALREAMINLILYIARQFPIIRFDAAMTLARRQIERLWFPEPGAGGGIPSRAEHGMTREQFDKLMPAEFWREVVDRAAIEAPDTLLLAEAFWMLESYFVRTLGMHRVYNSAFMNMFHEEENAQYRALLKNTLEFDPEILRRYVNFMSNPDEKTAVEQFGKGDKYFGICTLLVTMPGLPMLGHGQIEGYAEKYGMEYYRAYWDEQADDELMRRHEREIFPLCRKRSLFAGVENFLLYDFFTPDNHVDENVLAYSNQVGDERSLVLYNNVYSDTRGWINLSAAYLVKTGEGEDRVLVQRTLGEGLALPNEADQYLIFREQRSNLEYIRSCQELCERGFYAELNAYQCLVLLDFRVVVDSPTYHYGELAAQLNGRGVGNIDEALREIQVEPILTPFRTAFNADTIARLLTARQSPDEPDESLIAEIEQSIARLLEAVEAFNTPNEPESVPDDELADEPPQVIEADSFVADLDDADDETEPMPEAQPLADQLRALLTLPDPMQPELNTAALWGGLLGWVVVNSLGSTEQARSWIDEWLLGRAISGALGQAGIESGSVGRALSLIKTGVYRPDLFADHLTDPAQALLDELLLEPDAKQLLNVNEFGGVRWYNQEGLDDLLLWLDLLPQVFGVAADDKALAARQVAIEQLRVAAARSEYQLDRLQAGLKVAKKQIGIKESE